MVILKKKFLVGALAATLMTTACDESLQLTQAANDPSDTCNSFRQTIAAARQTDLDRQAAGAAIGALAGAFLGSRLAGEGNRTEGALAGLALGGLTGYSAVYAQQVKARAQDQNTLLRTINSDASKERTLVTQTGRAAVALHDCRLKQIRSLSASFKAKRISAAAAKAQLATIRRRAAGDNQIISASFNGIGKRIDAYVDTAAASASVERSLIYRKPGTSAVRADAGSKARASRVRSSAPQVRSVAQTRDNQLNRANSRANTVSSELESLNILLG